MTTPADAPALPRVMGIFAHPDDPEFFCGGTFAKWAAEGRQIVFVLATSGDKGSGDLSVTSETLIPIREAEERAAAARLGVQDVIFLRYPDGELQPTLELRRQLTRLIRLKRPDIVVTNDPTARWFGAHYINHPDHRAAGQAVIDAVFPAAGNPRVIVMDKNGEPVPPHQVEEVWLAYTHQPDLKIELGEYFEKKVRALLCHVSQIRETSDAFRERMKTRWEKDPKTGEEHYFEKFKRIQF